jgi:hypothetical protein
MTVTCINNEGFSLITKGKSYPVINESRDFYYIINNNGIEKRYGKNRFTLDKGSLPKEEKAPPVKKEKVKIVICKFAKPGVIEYNNEYTVKRETADHYIVNVDGTEYEVLKTRFVNKD